MSYPELTSTVVYTYRLKQKPNTLSYNKTTPIPITEASISIMIGCTKSGRARFGADTMALFTASKKDCYSGTHANTLEELNRLESGATKVAYPRI